MVQLPFLCQLILAVAYLGGHLAYAPLWPEKISHGNKKRGKHGLAPFVKALVVVVQDTKNTIFGWAFDRVMQLS